MHKRAMFSLYAYFSATCRTAEKHATTAAKPSP
jgi:hypothetical protein